MSIQSEFRGPSLHDTKEKVDRLESRARQKRIPIVDRSTALNSVLRAVSSGTAQPLFEETPLPQLAWTVVKCLHLRTADAEDRVRPAAFTR